MTQEIFVEGNLPLLRRQRPSGTAVVWASVASVVVGGPLLGMMGFIIMASLTLLLLASPFFLFFSPLLLPAAFVLAAATVGFSAAAAMAVVSIFSFAWLISAVRRGRAATTSALTESGRQVKTQVFPAEHHPVMLR